MKSEKLYSIILSPLVTEKATAATDKANCLSFKVARWANKTEITKALKSLFNVDPISVNTSTVKGKVKKFKGVNGSRETWKKAMVRLPNGQDINILDFE